MLKVTSVFAMDVLAGNTPVKVLSKRVHQGASNLVLELIGEKHVKRKKAKKAKKVNALLLPVSLRNDRNQITTSQVENKCVSA